MPCRVWVCGRARVCACMRAPDGLGCVISQMHRVSQDLPHGQCSTTQYCAQQHLKHEPWDHPVELQTLVVEWLPLQPHSVFP